MNSWFICSVEKDEFVKELDILRKARCLLSVYDERVHLFINLFELACGYRVFIEPKPYN